MPTSSPNSNPSRSPSSGSQIPRGDGTRQLLQWGASMLGAGFLAGVLLETLLGGFSPAGASTNAGWLALIVALMCIPFGGLLTALGAAKWLRNRSTTSATNTCHREPWSIARKS
jgi:hypothetical protein